MSAPVWTCKQYLAGSDELPPLATSRTTHAGVIRCLAKIEPYQVQLPIRYPAHSKDGCASKVELVEALVSAPKITKHTLQSFARFFSGLLQSHGRRL